MAETGQNAEFYAGDDARLNVTLTDTDGAALDLTGATLNWRMRSGAVTLDKSSDDAAEIDVTDAPGGLASVIINADDTADLAAKPYQHNLRITDTNGKVETLLTGTITLKGSL